MRWLWCLGLLTAGCINSPVSTGPDDPIAGSETHWLGLCSDAVGCPAGAECICGVCTDLCPDDDACSRDGRAGHCATPADVAQLCGRPVAPAVCVQDCAGDGDCAEGARCADGACVPRAPVEQRSGGLRSQIYNTPPVPAVDYLFVVDNSGSMCEEQRALGRAFAQVVADMARVDFRVAVVTTDLQRADAGRFVLEPAPPVPALNCLDPDTGDPITPDTADCQGVELNRILSAELGLDEAELARQFRCLTTVGTGGDGFEKGLESMRLALSCTGPNAGVFAGCCQDGVYVGGDCEPAFLRPDADLMVVLVTDEDDCSDPVANNAASKRVICRYGPIDADADGIPDGYRDVELCNNQSPADCFAAECGGESAEECAQRCEISRSENANCEWFRDWLTPVSDYADFLNGLKASPEQIAIAAFVGEQLRMESGEVVRYDPPEPPEPSCMSELGVAFAGHRYIELATHFPTRCGPTSGCDLCSGQLDLSGQAGANFSFCLYEPPRCAVQEGGGVRSCSMEEMRDPTNHRLEFAVTCDDEDGRPGCDPDSTERVLPPDAFALTPDDACPGGWAIRPDTPVDHGARVRITYLPQR